MSRCRAQRREVRNWATISPAVNCRRKPDQPVAQKVHPSGQPACDEMHRVRRERVGISTDSTSSPSQSRHRCFTVPSRETDTLAVAGSSRRKAVPSTSRSLSGRSFISPKLRASLWNTQRST